MKKVVVLGKGSLCVKICEWFLKSKEYELSCVVPVLPEPSWTDSLSEWAKLKNIKIITSGNYRDLDFAPDLAMSVFYDKIFKKDFIDSCGKIINLHNSPLPRYRGVSPINWALKNNEKEHGVTIHEITPGIDDGPIIGQIKYSIYPDIDEVKDVYLRALNYGYVLFEQTAPLFGKIVPRLQDDSESLYYDSTKNVFLGDRRYFTKSENGAR
tara:strand:- start:1981 stop:2613 length:633 start_codon:yes stop_codon:yes gene_type:complete